VENFIEIISSVRCPERMPEKAAVMRRILADNLRLHLKAVMVIKMTRVLEPMLDLTVSGDYYHIKAQEPMSESALCGTCLRSERY